MLAPLFLALAITGDPLHISEPNLAAGDVRIGPSLVRKFAFTNAGTEPITITDVHSSCGCLVPTLAKRDYKPGEGGELTVEVNTLSQPAGPHRWTFTLAYRRGDVVGERTLELTAILKQEIEISPAAIAFRGDGPLSARVTIRDPRSRPLKIGSITASAPYLTATHDPATGIIEVRVGDACPEGRHAETIVIATDDPEYREIKLPVTIDREPKRRVTALPNRATLIAGGSAVVQLRADVPLQVESVEASAPALTCRWAAGPGERTTVRISLDRAKWDGKPLTAEVRVRLKAPAGETVVIPVSVRSDD